MDLAALSEQQRFQLLIDGVADYAIYLLDSDGFIATWNSGAALINGYTADEVIGRHFSKFFTEEDIEADKPDHALAAARSQGRHEAEGWRVRKDGTRFWALAVLDAIKDESGSLIGFAKITRDITVRRAAQIALFESEQQLRILVDGVTDYALFMLDPNGIVSNWNRGAARIKGYTADEVVNHHFSMFYTVEDRAAGLPARAIESATAHGRFEAEGWRVRKDGSRFWASAVLDAIHDNRGKVIGFAKITRNITERRDAQIALQRAENQLAESQKMEALGQLTGGVAHDFNNLLMIVTGQAHILKRRITDPRALRAIDFIEQAAKRGASLTRQLLTFSRRQRLDPIVVDLRRRMKSFSDLLASAMEGNVEFSVDIGSGIWPVEVDIGELELALVNLAINARDAMPNGGLITVSARNARLEGREKPRIQGDFVALTVSDTGQGIPPDILPRIFEPFFTTKEVGKGTGLGLSQVYGFTHQSGGAVTVDTEFGRGAAITMYLPRSRRPLSAAGEEPETATPEPIGGTVLVVEDNAEVAIVSSALLEDIGYRVAMARTAADALAELEKNPGIDIVFSDIVMPGEMNGVALAEAVRIQYPGIPVLLTSGYSRAADVAQGKFPILRKPYSASSLSAAIRNAMAGKPTAAIES